jgi:plasmid maintenance system antidote protein VapI
MTNKEMKESLLEHGHVTRHPGDELRALAEKVGITGRALAKESGVAKSHVSHIMNGLRDINTETSIRLARVLGIEDMYLRYKQVEYEKFYILKVRL